MPGSDSSAGCKSVVGKPRAPASLGSLLARAAQEPAECGRPVAAAVPVASLAALPGRRFQKRGQFRLRALITAGLVEADGYPGLAFNPAASMPAIAQISSL